MKRKYKPLFLVLKEINGAAPRIKSAEEEFRQTLVRLKDEIEKVLNAS
jgi:uncharacterized protein YdcH (DUF465 family)